MQTPRTKAKIKENLGLMMGYLQKKYGGVFLADEEDERILFNALDWTAYDVAQQMRDAATARADYVAEAEKMVDLAKRESGHSLVEDHLIDALDALIEAVK